MAIYRKIHISFWADVFIQSLTPEQKFFFLYLLTNERTKQCGIYEITPRQISFDTGYTVETVLLLIDFFTNSGKVIFSRETNEIAIKNWNKYNSSDSPSVKNLVNKEVAVVKNKKLIEWVQSVDTVPPHNKKVEGGEPEPVPTPEPTIEVEVGSEKISKIANEVWKDEKWKEGMCIGLSITMPELIKWLALFNSSVSTHKDRNFDKSSYKRMSRGWISVQQSKGVKVETGIQRKSDSAPLTKLTNHGV